MSNTKKIKSNTNKQIKSKLNLNVINSANEKQFTTKTVAILVDGKEYEVEISQVFKTTKIEKMVMNFIKSENIKEIEKLEDGVRIGYFMYLIIKNFTNLDIPDNLEFEKEIHLIDSLIDLGIFENILKEIPDEEIKKCNEYLRKLSQNMQQILDEGIDDKLVGELKKGEIESGGEIE